MMAFAAARALGGIFPETCADGVNAVCRNMEWNFQFSLDQYLAFQRTRGGQSPPPGSTGTWPEPQSSHARGAVVGERGRCRDHEGWAGHCCCDRDPCRASVWGAGVCPERKEGPM